MALGRGLSFWPLLAGLGEVHVHMALGPSGFILKLMRPVFWSVPVMHQNLSYITTVHNIPHKTPQLL